MLLDAFEVPQSIQDGAGSVALVAGKATVDGVLVAEAEVMCKLQDKPKPE